MKTFQIILILLLSIFNAQAQTDWEDFDEIVRAESGNIEELAMFVADDYEDDMDKIQAIYYWVTHNVEFDFRLLEKLKNKKKSKQKLNEKQKAKQKEKEIKSAFKKKRGVSYHYALIFKTLCDYAGIECEIVKGWAKTNPNVGSKTGGTHHWNAVKIKDEWQLVDASLGSGYQNDEGGFEYEFDPNYFFADKDGFLLSHYPKDSKWQFVENIITKNDYKLYPFIGRAYLEFGMSDYAPLTKTIEVKKGEDAVITFKAKEKLTAIECYKLGKEDELKITVEVDGDNYKVILNTEKLRSGKYIFVTDYKTLFMHKIVIR